jgi:hypothetical protein
MWLDFIRDESSRWRRIAALACMGAVLAAIVLSDAPRLHEKLHKVNGAGHVCAATMMASGNCEHSAPPSLSPKIQNPPVSPAFLQQGSRVVIAAVPFSVLEHAPPAH